MQVTERVGGRNIYVIRHGQSLANAQRVTHDPRNDMGMSNLGRLQSIDRALQLKNEGVEFNVIYSSPLKRARETANTINNILHIPGGVKIHKDLAERDLGELSGLTDSELASTGELITIAGRNYLLRGPGVEEFPKVLESARRVLAEVTQLHPEGNIMLISHLSKGKMIYAAHYGLDWEEGLAAVHTFPNAGVLRLS